MEKHFTLRLVAGVVLFCLCVHAWFGQSGQIFAAQLKRPGTIVWVSKFEKSVVKQSVDEKKDEESSQSGEMQDDGVQNSIEESSDSQDLDNSDSSLETVEDQEKVIVVTQMISAPSSLVTVIGNAFSQKKVGYSSVKRVGKKIVLRWKAIKGAAGYQLQYIVIKKTAKKLGKNSIVRRLKKGKSYYGKDCTLNISGVSSNQSLYVRVRAYAKGKRKRVYTKWSVIKSVT